MATTNTIESSAHTTATAKGTLGLIAGEGKLPAILARSAKAQGYKVVSLALSEDAQARVIPHSDVVHLIAPGQIGRNLNLAKQEKCDFIVFIGKIPKIELLKNFYKLDWIAVKELSRLPDFSDDTIQRACGDFMESHGLKVLTQSQFLRELFPEVGVVTKQQPSASEYADIAYGKRIAKEIAELHIGQTVIVKDQMILAIEAIEGTDEAIRRAVRLANGPVVVVKVAKANADARFDTPAVGLNTLNAMLSSNPGGVLAVGAGETMLVEKDAMVEFAHKHEMSIVAI